MEIYQGCGDQSFPRRDQAADAVFQWHTIVWNKGQTLDSGKFHSNLSERGSVCDPVVLYTECSRDNHTEGMK